MYKCTMSISTVIDCYVVTTLHNYCSIYRSVYKFHEIFNEIFD